MRRKRCDETNADYLKSVRRTPLEYARDFSVLAGIIAFVVFIIWTLTSCPV